MLCSLNEISRKLEPLTLTQDNIYEMLGPSDVIQQSKEHLDKGITKSGLNLVGQLERDFQIVHKGFQLT